MTQKVEHENHTTGLEIAIIGMAVRFPGASDLEQYWENLKNGVESISFFSDEELRDSEVSPHFLQLPNFVKAKGILEDVECFDATFFNYSPREAAIMDPQLRILHECTYKALEHAGYASEFYKGIIGFYVGIEHDPYWKKRFDSASFSEYLRLAVLTESQYFTTQVAYKLNLKGPCFTLQTACSSSLVAIDQACRGLLTGESDIALAGGITIRLPQKGGHLYEEGMVGSKDGHCRAFDAKANGTVFSDGIGMVVLKPLQDALADGDTIHAVIRGTAVNNDGTRKIGFTAPSVEGETEVIKTALEMAEVDPESITYVETHGSATPLGDTIEIEALKEAFNTSKQGFCRIGSVKTNVGHLYTAAGVASLVKTVLALKHRMIPPSLHFEKPNPRIDFNNSPFYVNTALSEWNSNGYPLRAGISSFGVGGTNAHAILEETPQQEASSESRPWQIITLSAKTESTLNSITENLVDYIRKHPEMNLADAAYTLNIGRNDFNHRRMAVCSSVDEVITALSDNVETAFSYTIQNDEKKSVVFMFAGQGAQYVDMGLELYEHEPVFREEMDRCFSLLQPLLGYDMKDILYPSPSFEKEAQEKINQTAVTQPLIFAFEYALAKLLMHWGIQPYAMIGYSFGEYVAACLSGVFSLEDALRLITVRGELMNRLPTGAMVSVHLPEEELKPLLTPDLSLAIINGPSCIVGGSEKAIQTFEKKMRQKRLFCMRVSVAHAAHSVEMDPIMKEFEDHLKKVTLRPPKLPYISNISGTWIAVEDAIDPQYWVRHMRETVRFSDGIQELKKNPNTVFVEIGPGQDLSILVNRFIDGNPIECVMDTVRNQDTNVSDLCFLLKRVGRLWCTGVNIDWKVFYDKETRHRIPLPTYPFERQSYWTELNLEATETNATVSHYKKNLAEWFYLPSWKRSVLPNPPLDNVSTPQTWLIFEDECGIGTQFIKRITRENNKVVLVKQADEFAKIEEGLYTLNPKEPKHYKALVKELIDSKKIPNKIGHLWGVSPQESVRGAFQSLQVESMQDRGFYSLLYLMQALGEHPIPEELRIIVITNNMQAVAGEEVLYPEKATVLGPCRTIPQEYSNIQCRSIDIHLPPSGSWQEKVLANQLFKECVLPSDDHIIAYRGCQRWVQTFEPATLEASEAPPSVLREQGVYLITGGLGGIGLTLAEYLAKRIKAKLILIDWIDFPTEEGQDQWIATHTAVDPLSQKIETIKRLKELGAEVMILQADVADEEQMKKATIQARQRFGKIHGVIHAAGILTSGIMQLKTKEVSERVFASKIQGTIVLHRLFQDSELDCFILCSALYSLLQGVGLVDSVAADAFLDAFAVLRASTERGYSTSINWDLWRDVGMAMDAEQHGINIPLDDAISPEEGNEVFERILNSQVPHIVVSSLDLKTRLQQSISQGVLDVARSQMRTGSEKTHGRPKLSVAYVAPQNETEQKIAQIFQQHFGFDCVGIHDNFFELGATSLDLIQITLKLKDTIGEEIPVTMLFTYPTISTLVAYLTQLKMDKQIFSEEDKVQLEKISNRKDRLAKRKALMEVEL